MKYRDRIAPYWFEVGIELLQNKYYLNLVETQHRDNKEQCCMQMLKYWLMVDDEASWNKLIDALQSVHLNAVAARVKRDIISGG